jgi:hypothetical protein
MILEATNQAETVHDTSCHLPIHRGLPMRIWYSNTVARKGQLQSFLVLIRTF